MPGDLTAGNTQAVNDRLRRFGRSREPCYEWLAAEFRWAKMRLPSFRGSRLAALAIIAASIPALTVNKSLAACVFAPSAGDNAYICDSGTVPSLTDIGGNNSLTFPAGGTGVITGAVTFGGGVDSITMNSGTIGGAVAEGSGIDDFAMSAGTVASRQQGDGYDTFAMTGGTITGAFEDGDMAHQSGGTIGRVDMKLADNFYYLSGNGKILGNLVTSSSSSISA